MHNYSSELYNYSSELHKYSFFAFHYGNHLWDFICSSAYNCYYIPACIYGHKNNGVVSFILNNRRKFGRASDRGCEAD